MVHRFALVGKTWPTFDAIFQLYYFKGDPNALSARLNAKGHVALHGSFSESDARTFPVLRDVLRRDAFYDLRLTPQRASYLDGAVDGVSVTRCSVETTVGMIVGGEFDNTNGQMDRLLKLLNDLQTAIFALPWKPVPSLSPTPSP